MYIYNDFLFVSVNTKVKKPVTSQFWPQAPGPGAQVARPGAQGLGPRARCPWHGHGARGPASRAGAWGPGPRASGPGPWPGERGPGPGARFPGPRCQGPGPGSQAEIMKADLATPSGRHHKGETAICISIHVRVRPYYMLGPALTMYNLILPAI